MRRYLYQEFIDGDGASMFELVRKDARTARRHIHATFGPHVRIKLVESEEVPDCYTLYIPNGGELPPCSWPEFNCDGCTHPDNPLRKERS